MASKFAHKAATAPAAIAAPPTDFEIYEDPTLTQRGMPKLSAFTPMAPQLQSTPFISSMVTPMAQNPIKFDFQPASASSFKPAQQAAQQPARPMLSPIIEVSREDRSSVMSSSVNMSRGSFASSVSSNRSSTQQQQQAAAPVSGNSSFPLSLAEKKSMLSKLNRSIASIPGVTLQMSSRVPPIAIGQTLQLPGATPLTISSQFKLQEGNVVYSARQVETGFSESSLAPIDVHVAPEPCPWEFYIAREIQDRIGKMAFSAQRARHSFVEPHGVFVFGNGCVTTFPNESTGNLSEVLQMLSAQSRAMVCILIKSRCKFGNILTDIHLG